MFNSRRRFPFYPLLVASALMLAPVVPATAAPYWVASWAASPTPAQPGTPLYQNQTVREIVRLTEGGEQIRVRLTNRYGASPLTIGAATVALRAQGSTISPDTLQTLTFNGQPTATIPPGADLISDPVSMLVGPQADIAVSLYLPNANPAASIHLIQRSAIYTALENQASAASFPPSTAASDGQPWVWLDGVDVSSVSAVPVIVTFGDSITDGYKITRDTAHDWPDVLSQRLQQAHRPGAVVNAGIGGNRILHDSPSQMVSFWSERAGAVRCRRSRAKQRAFGHRFARHQRYRPGRVCNRGCLCAGYRGWPDPNCAPRPRSRAQNLRSPRSRPLLPRPNPATTLQ